MKKSLLYGTVFTAFCAIPLAAFADFSCDTTQPSCEALGYNKTLAECNGAVALKCPFPENKYFCIPNGSTPPPPTPTCDLSVFTGCPVDTCEDRLTLLCDDVFNGPRDTDAIIAAIGSNSAAGFCRDYYPTGVNENDAVFGKGKWYMPAIGEWLDVYGISSNHINSSMNGSWNGSTVQFTKESGEGENITKINNALRAIADAGVFSSQGISANDLDSNINYLSTTETGGGDFVFAFYGFNQFAPYAKNSEQDYVSVRPFLLIEDVTKAVSEAGKNSSPCYGDDVAVGDVVYSDGSRTTYDCLDFSKKPVGVVIWKSEHGRSVKLISLDGVESRIYRNYSIYNVSNFWNYWGSTDDIQAITSYSSLQLVDLLRDCNLSYGIGHKATHDCFGNCPEVRSLSDFISFLNEEYVGADEYTANDAVGYFYEEIYGDKAYGDTTLSERADTIKKLVNALYTENIIDGDETTAWDTTRRNSPYHFYDESSTNAIFFGTLGEFYQRFTTYNQTCNGTNEIGGAGEVCNGMYVGCRCNGDDTTTGYAWDYIQGKCDQR